MTLRLTIVLIRKKIQRLVNVWCVFLATDGEVLPIGLIA